MIRGFWFFPLAPGKAGEMKEKSEKIRLFSVRSMVEMAMLGAIATILMALEIPLPFAPPFYKLDFSEIPILIGAFAISPWAGVIIEALKVLLHVVFFGTTSMGVGDFANFFIGISLVVPASVIYFRGKSRKSAAIGMGVGTLIMTVIGCAVNAFVLLPLYAKMFEMPLDALIAMGTAVNSHITDIFTFVFLAVTPFNLLKGVLVSVITFLIYKRISRLLKSRQD